MLNTRKRRRVEVFDLNYRRKALGVNAIDKIRNLNVRERYRNRRSLLKLMDQTILKFFRHMERMDELKFTKKIYKGR